MSMKVNPSPQVQQPNTSPVKEPPKKVSKVDKSDLGDFFAELAAAKKAYNVVNQYFGTIY